jgi:hypothetical protein
VNGAVSIPQPLTGDEIKKGIAVRMTQDLPAAVQEALREQIVSGLGKTCSLLPNSAYAKFKAEWRLGYVQTPEFMASWWVDYELDDFGRVTKGGIGGSVGNPDGQHCIASSGTIDEVPPDRFRRETDQPIPKPTELKKPDAEKSTFSKSLRGQGRRRQV